MSFSDFHVILKLVAEFSGLLQGASSVIEQFQ
jgi:hypothetical protein